MLMKTIKSGVICSKDALEREMQSADRISGALGCHPEKPQGRGRD